MAFTPPKSRIETEVLRIRALLEKGQFTAALGAAQALLAEVPENRDLLYMLAVSQRYLKRIPEALATLARLEILHPNYSRLFQERGHCCVAIADRAGALAAYSRAVNLNTALPASWKALHILFQSTGQNADAEMAASHVAKLASLPTAVIIASSMFADGEIFEAERVIREFLQTHGDHIEGMRLLAQIGMKLDVLDDAEFILESVLVFAPDYHLARYDYANVLLQRHRHGKAQEECKALLRVEPDNRNYRAIYATACIGLGQYDEALRVYRELVAEFPGAADIHLSIAHALKTVGRQKEAIESYQTAAQVQPSFGDAYWSLANLKTYRFADTDVERMRSEEAKKGAKLIDQYHLCFALGKALEDQARVRASPGAIYERGNALKKSRGALSARNHRGRTKSASQHHGAVHP